MAEGGASDDLATHELDPELKLHSENVLIKLNLKSENGFSSVKWFELGLQLGVPKNELDIICTDHKGDELRCLSETISYWINNGNVTWKVLWEALCDPKVAHTNLGIEIRDWYWRKTRKDPRSRDGKRVWRTYIQLPGRNRCLRSVKCKPEDTGLKNAIYVSTDYFRVEPVVRLHIPLISIYRGHMDDLKLKLMQYLRLIEPHQKKFKVGYVARFGQIYWRDVADTQGDSRFWFNKEPRKFSPHISCEIGRLTREKCHPPLKEHCTFFVDPIKFVVDLPAHRDVVYVAVVSEVQGVFVLHDVYRQQKKPAITLFDIVQPQRKYDIRLSDRCDLICEVDDKKVHTIAEKINRSIHKNDDGHLSMQLVGEDYHVKFLRLKKQQVYRWKGKEIQKWYLAEYDLTEYDFEDEMTDAKLRDIRAKSGEWERRDLTCGKQKKEIELWSRKIFPEGFKSSHPSSRMYIEPEATGEVRMPNASAQPATKWTTEELMEDIDDFVQAAFDITSILEHC